MPACGTLGIELPARHEFHRIVQAALRGFFQDVYDRVTARLSASSLVPPWMHSSWWSSEETQSLFDQLKAEPAAPGVKHLQQEVTKLQTLRRLALPAEALADVPLKVLQLFKRRAHNEDAQARCGRIPPRSAIRCWPALSMSAPWK